MLLDSTYTIVPQLRFTLTYDNGIRKVITIKSNDNISCSYKKDGHRLFVTGVVKRIGCNFNSSLGAVGTTAYLEIDGSSEYSGEVIYVQPSQMLDITINSTSDITEDIVCSVDNEGQRVLLVRENEVGVFQYSLDGVTWKAAVGAQGKSAYWSACELGFVGSEAEWIASLKGPKGDTGEPGALEIYKFFNSIREAEEYKDSVPNNKLVCVKINGEATLYARKCKRHEHHCCGCGACVDNSNIGEIEYVRIRGYRYLGKLTVGPKGDPGEPGIPGKSAYQYAVEGGFTGTEEDFYKALGTSTINVTDFAIGKDLVLKHTVVGPLNLKVFGFTNKETFESELVKRIDIFSEVRSINQTLLFKNPIELRAVPTDKDSARPNIVVDGQKYVADYIGLYHGQIGIRRRIKVIESYNGEAIYTDWISSTGELDLGATVYCIYEGDFEPFDKELQSQYRKLHAYDGTTSIEVIDDTVVSAVYPINVKNFITNFIEEYLETHKQEVIVPVVKDVVDEKVGEVPEKYENVVEYIKDNTTIGETIVTKVDIGGIPAGTPIDSTEALNKIIKELVAPEDPVNDAKIYVGVSASIPSDVTGLNEFDVNNAALKRNGFTTKFTADNEHFVFAYDKTVGQLVHIRDRSGLENLDGWSHIETEDKYIYYSNENLTVTEFKLEFIYIEEDWR